MANPTSSDFTGHLRCSGKATVPYTSMVRTTISQRSYATHPAFQYLMVGQVELTGNGLLDFFI